MQHVINIIRSLAITCIAACILGLLFLVGSWYPNFWPLVWLFMIPSGALLLAGFTRLVGDLIDFIESLR